MPRRKAIPRQTKTDVLAESGYRCGNPNCGVVLTTDLLDDHHIVPVSEGGGNDPGNLLPLCPNHHAMYHRGDIPRDVIAHWKRMLVAMSHSFSRAEMDLLLFLRREPWSKMYYTPDGVARFAGLIVSGLVEESRHPLTPDDVVMAHVLASVEPQIRRSGEFLMNLDELEKLVPDLDAPALTDFQRRTLMMFQGIKETCLANVKEFADKWVKIQSDTDWYRPMLFGLRLTDRGNLLVDAWLAGDSPAYLGYLVTPGRAAQSTEGGNEGEQGRAVPDGSRVRRGPEDVRSG